MMAAFADGLRRVYRAPAIVVGAWLATLIVALPLAVALDAQLAAHLGDSLAAREALAGVNYDWWNEFLAQASGVGATFVPAIIGFAAVVKNLGGFLDRQSLPPLIGVAVVTHIALSMFFAGGVIDRLARDRAVGAGAFFSSCGVYFWRFLRLGVLAGAAYWVLFARVHPWLFDTMYPSLTRDLTVERTAFAYRVVLYAVFTTAVLLVNLVVDYAKIRAVVEDRRSMIGALIAGARFAWRNAGPVAGLYAADAVLFLLVLAAYAAAAPGGGANLGAFAVGQAYIVARVVVRLQFTASQVALFQSRLAHAGYVARPVPRWPDSPAAEAIGPR